MSGNSLPHRSYLNHDTSAQLDAWNIRAARLARGMTEAQLADAVGVRESDIRNIERDAKKSGGFFLNSDQTWVGRSIAEALDVDESTVSRVVYGDCDE